MHFLVPMMPGKQRQTAFEAKSALLLERLQTYQEEAKKEPHRQVGLETKARIEILSPLVTHELKLPHQNERGSDVVDEYLRHRHHPQC